MMETDCSIERSFCVRFAQVDSARVIYYPRYLEMLAETFPEAAMSSPPYDLSIRFLDSNRLGDTIRMIFKPNEKGWSVSGSMKHDHFSIVLTEKSAKRQLIPFQSALASFESERVLVRDWMCGPDGDLHMSRYYELISHTVEQWFESALAMSFKELHVVRNLGIPTVQLDTQCGALPRSGDTVSIALQPTSVGASAVQFSTWLIRSGKVLLETRQVIVFVNSSDREIRSTPVPERIRQSLYSYLAEPSPE